MFFINISETQNFDSELIAITNSEVVVKSKLSEQRDKVLIDIALPEGGNVGFEIYTDTGSIKHLWNDQQLSAGRHELSLKLPLLQGGRYLLHIKVNEQLFKHIVYLSY